MYFFITQVSLCDILLTTAILPNVLQIILYDGGSITLGRCFLQFYVFSISEASECLLLTVMSFDRYLAICNPLRYNTIMDQRFCVAVALVAWFLAFVLTLFLVLSVTTLTYCGPNVIDHFFCDLEPFLELSCSDTFNTTFQAMFFGVIVLICPFILIVISYIFIIVTIFAIPSITGRQKTFSTCSSHLTVVNIFYGTLISVYLVPTNGNLLLIKKMLSVFYTMVIPLLNPIIYSLRNKDIEKSLDKIILQLGIYIM
ncbi:olfactory receptor 8U3-like [Gastrophryne carolinensis]